MTSPGCDKCKGLAVHAVSCGTCANVYRRCARCGGRKAAMRQLSSHWTYVAPKGCPRGVVGLDEAIEIEHCKSCGGWGRYPKCESCGVAVKATRDELEGQVAL